MVSLGGLARGIRSLFLRRSVLIILLVVLVLGAVLAIALAISWLLFFASIFLFIVIGVSYVLYLARVRDFDFPVEPGVIEGLFKKGAKAAGAGRLDHMIFYRYYVDLTKAFGRDDFLRFVVDKSGVPRFRYGGKLGYNPTFVGWYALSVLQKYVRTDDQKYRRMFLDNAEWLLKNARHDVHKGVVWDHGYSWREGRHTISPPWNSSLGQGVAISVLCRAYVLTGKADYLETARKATKIFSIPVEEGGVLSVRDSHVYYDEYPVVPSVNVFDGFVFSLLGLYDLYLVTADRTVLTMYRKGADTVSSCVGQWDFFHMWSYYGSHRILSPRSYNKINSALLSALYQISVLEGKKDGILLLYARYWDPEDLSLIKKAFVISAGFVLTVGYGLRMAVSGGHY